MTHGKAVNLAGIWSLLLRLVHLDTDHVLSCELPPGSQTLYVYSGAAPDPPTFLHLRKLFTLDVSLALLTVIQMSRFRGGGRLFMCVLRLPNWNRSSICISI